MTDCSNLPAPVVFCCNVCAAIATDRHTLGAWHPSCCPLHMLVYCTWQPCSHKQITMH